MDDFENKHFLNKYQSVWFLNSNNEYLLSKQQRKCCILKSYASQSLLNSNAKVNDRQNSSKLYANIVDNKKGVNNYANIVVSLTSGRKIAQPQKWTSNLNSDQICDVLKCNTDENFTVKITSGEVTNFRNSFKNNFSSRSEYDNSAFNNCTGFSVETQTKSQVKTSFAPIENGFDSNENFGAIFEQNVSRNMSNSKQNQFSFSKRNATPLQRTSDNNIPSNNSFMTAKQYLQAQNMKQNKSNDSYKPSISNEVPRKTLGLRRNVNSKFVPPDREPEPTNPNSLEVEPQLKNIDPKMVELIRSEIMDTGNPITWDDIAGLTFAKKTIQEIVVWPLLRPDIFTGLRRPPKGILLFGPPGTGKTLIGKCIASQSQSTFFSISSSSLTSKWIGDGEKMVRALFAVARCHQPAVIFIDEIDSLLTQRSDTEHESSRRMKTEFLVQLDGAATGEEDRILIIGATNRPQELDEAARRRLVKRLYIPLPELEARKQIVERLMSSEKNVLTEQNIDEIGLLTEGYSGADMKSLCAEASLGPIRSIHYSLIANINPEQVRAINFSDFKSALNRVKASVSSKDLEQYVVWDQTYGSGAY